MKARLLKANAEQYETMIIFIFDFKC